MWLGFPDKGAPHGWANLTGPQSRVGMGRVGKERCQIFSTPNLQRQRGDIRQQLGGVAYAPGVYSELVDGDRIKVETSRGWEIASVIKYHQDDNSLDIEMFPDGERFLHCKPSVVKPHTAPNETALALWADNQRLRRRIAILSSLKAVFTSTAMVPCVALSCIAFVEKMVSCT